MRNAFVIGVVVCACSSRPIPKPPIVDETSFDLDPAALRRQGAPDDLVARLRTDAFDYYRMLAEPFELRVCSAFKEVLPDLPMTAVEGDAHLEQFAVTSSSYGLDDFDRGGFGPPVVDLVRYATSIHLACGQVKFPCDAEASVQQMLDAYRNALVTPPSPREPGVVVRMRVRATESKEQWLDKVQRSLTPLNPDAEKNVRRIWSNFLQSVAVPTATTAIVATGGLHDGVGSSTVERAVVRIAGPTESPADDLMVEIRRGIPTNARSCVWRGPPNESIALLVMSLIRREMPSMYGFVVGPTSAWLQSWDSSYVELSLDDLASQQDIDELAVDAGGQLAAHSWTLYPEPLRDDQRAAQLAAIDRARPLVLTTTRTLAAEVRAAWGRFSRR